MKSEFCFKQTKPQNPSEDPLEKHQEQRCSRTPSPGSTQQLTTTRSPRDGLLLRRWPSRPGTGQSSISPWYPAGPTPVSPRVLGTRLMRLIQLLSRGLGLPGIGAPALLNAGNPNLPVSFQATGVPSAGLRCWENVGSTRHPSPSFSWVSLNTGLQGKGRNKSITRSP